MKKKHRTIIIKKIFCLGNSVFSDKQGFSRVTRLVELARRIVWAVIKTPL